MIPTIGRLFDTEKLESAEELFESLLENPGFRLERIVSAGQSTPPGQWYDQDRDEWVILLRGAALLRFESNPEPVPLHPGDYLTIPAHCRHRVDWTDPSQPTIWLALHYERD